MAWELIEVMGRFGGERDRRPTIRRPKSCVFFSNFVELPYPPGALDFIVEYEFDF